MGWIGQTSGGFFLLFIPSLSCLHHCNALLYLCSVLQLILKTCRNSLLWFPSIATSFCLLWYRALEAKVLFPLCASTPLSCELRDLEADDVGVKRPSKRHVGVNTQLLFDAWLVDFQMPLPHLSQKTVQCIFFLCILHMFQYLVRFAKTQFLVVLLVTT